MSEDVATRSITAAVLRPKGTKAVDAALLLAQTLVPQPMRPDWPEYLSMAASVIPYTRLATIDARMQQAAARPVIRPSTVVIDQGKVFVSRCFLAAAEHLGITVQPCPPASGTRSRPRSPTRSRRPRRPGPLPRPPRRAGAGDPAALRPRRP